MRDCSNSVAQRSLPSAIDLSQIPYLWYFVLDLVTELIHEAVLSSANHYQGISVLRCRGWNLNFNSISKKRIKNLMLKNWCNYFSFRNGSIDSGIGVRTVVCKLSACWSPISKPSSTSAPVL